MLGHAGCRMTIWKEAPENIWMNKSDDDSVESKQEQQGSSSVRERRARHHSLKFSAQQEKKQIRESKLPWSVSFDERQNEPFFLRFDRGRIHINNINGGQKIKQPTDGGGGSLTRHRPQILIVTLDLTQNQFNSTALDAQRTPRRPIRSKTTSDTWAGQCGDATTTVTFLFHIFAPSYFVGQLALSVYGY